MTGPGLRFAEIAGSLSLATDLAAGIANEGALRTSVTATLVARAAGVTGPSLSDVHTVALFRYLGCSGYAHEEARLGAGDDHQMMSALETADAGRPSTILHAAFTRLARDASVAERARSIARFLSDPKGYSAFARAHCEQAVALAQTLSLRRPVVDGLGDIYERWDGAGEPAKKAGDSIALSARAAGVAFVVEVFHRTGGPSAAVAEVRKRSGGQLDPNLVDAFLASAPEILAVLGMPSVWDTFLELEPAPHALVEFADLGGIALAFGRYADVKSPFSIGHSPAVAALAVRIAERAKLGREDTERLRIAALLHDIGVVSVPNGILDKPGPLSATERERVEQHAYHTDRILSRTRLLAPFARIASNHHERLNGSGYPRREARTSLDLSSRILAVADVFEALCEERAYRAARTPAQAAAHLEEEARAGALDREVVAWTLEVLGAKPQVTASSGPDGLTEREVEVLVHLARGRSNKEIGRRLFISARTVQQHVRHIYEKTNVSTRAAAALYATEHELVGRTADFTPTARS